MSNTLRLYLHFPCFDGVVSAVLASEYLERLCGWTLECLEPVNYSQRNEWLSRSFSHPAAVVDFLFHPDADFWCDHHQTSFLEVNSRVALSGRSPDFFRYDSSATSCSILLWRSFGDKIGRADLEQLVQWADRIDSASYATPHDAILGTAPALKISLSLLADRSKEYCEFLVNALRKDSLDDVADDPKVSECFRRIQAAIERGLETFKRGAHLENDGIVVYDVVSTEGSIVSRYAPYFFYPEARYSIGISRFAEGAKITAMRNPWREFVSVPLGRIFSQYGGGGHQRVASLIVTKEELGRSDSLLKKIIHEIRATELDQWRYPEREVARD